MNKSLMILGGTGFFGKVLLDAYLNEQLKKYNINNLILVGNKFKKVKKILLNFRSKKKVFFFKTEFHTSKHIALCRLYYLCSRICFLQ